MVSEFRSSRKGCLGVEGESCSTSARRQTSVRRMAVAGVPMDVGSAASASTHAVRISRSIEDYPPQENLWIGRGSFNLDNFLRDKYCHWISRPPAADLKLVLEALSPGLDGRPLQRLNELAQDLIACGNDEEPMVAVCQEMRGLLQNVLEALAHEFSDAAFYETLNRTRGNEEERPKVGVPLQILEFFEKKMLVAIVHELTRSGNTEDARVEAVLSRVEMMIPAEMHGALSFRNVFEVFADKLIGSGNEGARSLMEWAFPCANEGEAMVDMVCQMRRFEFVLDAICEGSVENLASWWSDMIFFWGNVSFGVVSAMHRCGTLPHVIWAFTWVETLLLEHDMLGLPVRTSGVPVTMMEKNIRDRWHKLHFCIPEEWRLSKWSLDFHRRAALFSCGQETEAVHGFEVSDWWKGLEASYFCFAIKAMYDPDYRKPGKLSYGYSWNELEYKRRWWRERAKTLADQQDHDPGRLSRVLQVALVQGESFALQEIDFQLPFHFPVPFPSAELLNQPLMKLGLLLLKSRWKPEELVPEIIGPEVLDRPEMQNDFPQAVYAYGCVVLRGVQLIDHHGLLEEGLKVFHTCLAKGRSDSSILFGSLEVGEFEHWMFKFCEEIAMRDNDVDRANRVQAFLVAHGDSLSPADLAKVFGLNTVAVMTHRTTGYTEAFTPDAFGQQVFQVGSIANSGCGADPEAFWKCFKFTRAYIEPRYQLRQKGTKKGKMKALPGSWIPSFYMFHRSRWTPPVPVPFHELDATSKARVEAFWKTCYKDTCAALSQAAATEPRYEVRHMPDTRSSKLKTLKGSWSPYFHMYNVHVLAATVCRAFPCPEVVTKHELAREALLCLEKAKNYREEGFGDDINWNRIKRAHQACGPGAVFVQFAGLGWRPPKYGGSSDVWPDPEEHGLSPYTIIVVQDEGVASLRDIDWDKRPPMKVQELVREISSACVDREAERKLESDSCRIALETLYDLLIRPVFHMIFGTRIRNKCYPRRKLIISAVGYCRKVPFSILRNKDSGCYLFEEVKLAFTTSFLMLDHCQSRYEILQERTLLAGAGAAVALGDPHYSRYQPYDALPGSRKEVEAICREFDFCQPQYEIAKLLGSDATEVKLMELVKKASTGVETAGGTGQCSQAFIHIAAHGSGGKETNTGTVILADTPHPLWGGSARKGKGLGGSALGTPQSRTSRDVRAAPERGNVTVGSGDVAQSSDEESDEEPHESADSESSNMQATLSGHQVLEASDSQLDSAADPDSLEFLQRLFRALRGSDAGNSLKCDDILFSGLEWSAYMVVLSGCSTAVGAAVNANVLDIVSFNKAFMTRGVPCSILAQWPVHDSVGEHLMPLFYQALSQGEDACSALQSAMIKMHHSGEYTLCELAPFIVTGLPTVRLPLQMRRCTA